MKILIFYPGNLSNLRRGTPLRSFSIFSHLRKIATTKLLATKIPNLNDPNMHSIKNGPWGTNWFFAYKALRSQLQTFAPDIVYGCTHRSLALLWLACRKRARIVVDLHGLDEENPHASRFATFIKRRWYNFFLRRMNGITTPCTPLLELHRWTNVPGIVVPGGADVARISQIQPERIPSGTTPIITYCGNLNDYQGVDHLLASLCLLHKEVWHLLLICSSEEEKARKMIAHYGLSERTTLLCNQPQEKVFAHIKGADIAIIPRPDLPVTRYAFPSKLAECLATGVAVIATDVSDARFMVIPKKTGWLVAPSNKEELALALKDALSHPEKRKMYGEAALQQITTYWNWPKIVAKLTSFLYTLSE